MNNIGPPLTKKLVESISSLKIRILKLQNYSKGYSNIKKDFFHLYFMFSKCTNGNFVRVENNIYHIFFLLLSYGQNEIFIIESKIIDLIGLLSTYCKTYLIY